MSQKPLQGGALWQGMTFKIQGYEQIRIVVMETANQWISVFYACYQNPDIFKYFFEAFCKLQSRQAMKSSLSRSLSLSLFVLQMVSWFLFYYLKYNEISYLKKHHLL